MGLLYIDAENQQDVAFVKTVRENFEGFTKKNFSTNNLDCEANAIIGYPSGRYFKSMMRKKLKMYYYHYWMQ